MIGPQERRKGLIARKRYPAPAIRGACPRSIVVLRRLRNAVSSVRFGARACAGLVGTSRGLVIFESAFDSRIRLDLCSYAYAMHASQHVFEARRLN